MRHPRFWSGIYCNQLAVADSGFFRYAKHSIHLIIRFLLLSLLCAGGFASQVHHLRGYTVRLGSVDVAHHAELVTT